MSLPRLVLAAALAVTAAGATAATAEPDPPGGPCHIRMEKWIATDVTAVPYVGPPYLDCYY